MKGTKKSDFDLLADQYLLGPSQQWKQNRVFPFKPVLHILLIFCAILVSLSQNEALGVSRKLLGHSFVRLFYPDEYEEHTGDGEDNPQKRYFIFTAEDYEEAVELMMQRYWAMPSIALLPVTIADEQSGNDLETQNTVPLPRVYYFHYGPDASELLDPSLHHSVKVHTEENIMYNSEDIYPLRLWEEEEEEEEEEEPVHLTKVQTLTRSSVSAPFDTRKDWYGRLNKVMYDLRFHTQHPDPNKDTNHNLGAVGCYEWSAKIVYDFRGRNHFEVLHSVDRIGRCDASQGPGASALTIFIYALGFLVAALHELLATKSAVKWISYFLYAYKRQKRENASVEYTPLSGAGDEVSACHHGQNPRPLQFRDIFSLIMVWSVVTSIGSIVFAAVCIWQATRQFDLADPSFLLSSLLSISCVCLFVSTLKYASHSPRWYANMSTFKNALPRIGVYLMGVMPIFFSFVLFGMCMFGRNTPRWSDPSFSPMTAYSFLHGDALLETFKHTEDARKSLPPSLWYAKRMRGRAPGASAAAKISAATMWWNNPAFSWGNWSYGFQFKTIIADLYLCMVIIFFFFLVVNCIIAVIEEAFFNTRTDDAVSVITKTNAKSAALPLRIRLLKAWKGKQ